MIFIQKGDAPMTERQAEKRGRAILDSEMKPHDREAASAMQDPAFIAWAEQWVVDNLANVANNIFNNDLAKYRAALARLDRYRLAEGRPEITEEIPTGAFDEEGNEILETRIVQSAVDPLEPEVEVATFDPETGEETGTELVPNPLIVADDAERAEAQALIDALSEEVKTFDAA